MQLWIILEGRSSLSKLPWTWPSSKLGLDLLSHKTLADTFTGRVDCSKDQEFFNQHKQDTTKSLGSDKIVKYVCDIIMDLTALPRREKKYDWVEMIDIG